MFLSGRGGSVFAVCPQLREYIRLSSPVTKRPWDGCFTLFSASTGKSKSSTTQWNSSPIKTFCLIKWTQHISALSWLLSDRYCCYVKERFYHNVASQSCFQDVIQSFCNLFQTAATNVIGFVWRRGEVLSCIMKAGVEDHISPLGFSHLKDWCDWQSESQLYCSFIHLIWFSAWNTFKTPHSVHSLKEDNLQERRWMAVVDMQLVSHGF